MSQKSTRRSFLKASALGSVGFWVSSRPACARRASANERLNLAVIGIGGRGKGNLEELGKENIVVLCDVDERQTGFGREKHPKAKFCTDFRCVVDRPDVDAVAISTPDHTHAVIAVAALQAGKHVYCEKPLTHSVYEARTVTDLARKQGLATQMGTQVHSGQNYRRVVELIQKGAVGPVREVHVWVSRQWGGKDRPKETPPIPEGLNYDLWLGPAPYRPYHPEYLPANWRGWWDFGGGTLGDMACHYMDLPFWALGLKHPTSIEAEGPAVHPESCPPMLTVRYEFPARGDQPPVKLVWYHGGLRPPQYTEPGMPQWGDALVFVGDKGMLAANYDDRKLLPERDFVDFKAPEPFIAPSIGHHKEWIEACKGGKPALCNFDYAGPLTEAVLLGNVSYRTGRKLEWDARQLKAVNAPEAEQFLRRQYRKGWTL